MKKLILAMALSLGAAAPALAQAPAACDARALQSSWDHVNYEVARAQRAAQMEQLATQATRLIAQCPNRAEPLIWGGIIKASAAGLKGGMGALGLVRDARTLLEQAEKISPNALDGSVYTSLGSLYAQVPGPPLAFGDKTKARSYLTKALAANPNGIDPNFFMGDFLFRQKDYAGAIRYLEKAIAAPARPGREVADRGRRAEAQALLADAHAKAHG